MRGPLLLLLIAAPALAKEVRVDLRADAPTRLYRRHHISFWKTDRELICAAPCSASVTLPGDELELELETGGSLIPGGGFVQPELAVELEKLSGDATLTVHHGSRALSILSLIGFAASGVAIETGAFGDGFDHGRGPWSTVLLVGSVLDFASLFLIWLSRNWYEVSGSSAGSASSASPT